MLPKFDSIYSGNKFVHELLSSSPERFDVQTPLFYDSTNCNGTKIRMNIVMDKQWKEYVPDPVHRIISNLNGVQRIKILLKLNVKEQMKLDHIQILSDNGNMYEA